MQAININSVSERNKLIAAIVLGILALVSLWLAFGSGGSQKNASTIGSSTPTPNSSPAVSAQNELPSKDEQNFIYQTVPVNYSPRVAEVPEPGRNIFAFYEPPPPTPYVPTPIPVKTPEPTPTPPFSLAVVSPASVYAGSKNFRIEAVGDKFTADAKIYFNGIELPTQFVSPQRLAANVPSNMISSAGSAQVVIKNNDGSKYSLPVTLIIQPPPTPNFKFIGLIARKMANNDTAYFQEGDSQLPFAARLGDVVGGRFKVISISSEKVVLEDVTLGFRHNLELFRPPPGTTVATGTLPPQNYPQPGMYPPGFSPQFQPNPNNPNGPPVTQGIPGIPDGIPIYRPQMRPGPVNSNVNRPPDKPDDEDDNEPVIDNRKR
ncbi:MAG TPA: TIG domain-containing protein [Pyrinomonadaceae bacterium]|jgi:hypothetical protein|nr:TIG domain-containing protein [Pyrinomonadaceae bacterium]